MRVLVALVLAFTAVTAVPTTPPGRIIGGSVTDIANYPEMVSVLFAWNSIGHRQFCGGIIINNRSILTAAHCTASPAAVPYATSTLQSRVGSTFANSGGAILATSAIILHPNYGTHSVDYDLSIIRTVSAIGTTNVIRPGRFAGANYNLGDNEVVWATGWGFTELGSMSEELRHVQIWTINQDICKARYAFGSSVTDNMLCSGWLDVGGRDQCQGDSGGPVYHNGVVVGVCSWGVDCASPFFPGVNMRVSRFIDWIQLNA